MSALAKQAVTAEPDLRDEPVESCPWSVVGCVGEQMLKFSVDEHKVVVRIPGDAPCHAASEPGPACRAGVNSHL